MSQASAKSDRLELGCATIGGFNLSTEPSPSRAIELVKTSLELGVRRFDNAALYGYYLAEELLAHAFDVLGVERSSINVNTKVGRAIVPKIGRFASSQPPSWTLPNPFSHGVDTWDMSYAGILTSFYGSMTRLKIDAMDVALHDPADAVNEIAGLTYSDFDDAFRALQDLKQAGYATALGVAGKTIAEMVEMLNRYGDIIDFIETTCYNLVDHADALQTLIPLCKRYRVEVRVAGPFASGILAGADPCVALQAGQQVLCNYTLATDGQIKHVGEIWDAASVYGQTNLRHLAIQLVTLNPDVDRIVLGANDAQQLRSNVQQTEQHLPDELWSALKAKSLIASDTPTEPPCNGRAPGS